MLTNFHTIRGRIARLTQLKAMAEDGTFDLLPKKEVIKLNHEIEKLEKFLGGIKDMEKLPALCSSSIPAKRKSRWRKLANWVFRLWLLSTPTAIPMMWIM